MHSQPKLKGLTKKNLGVFYKKYFYFQPHTRFFNIKIEDMNKCLLLNELNASEKASSDERTNCT